MTQFVARLLFFMLFSVASAARPAHVGVDAPWKIVNFWSITCAPCRIEIPELNALNEELAGSGVAVVGVNFDDDPRAQTMALAKRMGIRFPTLTASEVNLLKLEPPNALPTTYILSADNTVRAKLIGPQSRETINQKLLELGINRGKVHE